MTVKTAETTEKTTRLPRRRRDFQGLSEETIGAIVRRAIGPNTQAGRIVFPDQGINNQTYLVARNDGPDLVIKVRPGRRAGDAPAPAVKNSPQWPRYTQELLGPFPNGDISTLPSVTAALEAGGTIRVPHVYLVDESFELVPAPYLVSERLPGTPFGWNENALARPDAAGQLGEHLASVHQTTGGGQTFGIYARRDSFEAADWWPRFARSCRTMVRELTRGSTLLRSVEDRLEAALVRAPETGSPDAFPLICIDQNPTHYLNDGDGGVAAMIDVEGHLWGPREWELATVELWLQNGSAFRKAYTSRHAWPPAMEAVRPAYQFYTWMEWIYCNYTLLHDEAGAAALERHLVERSESVFSAS